YSLGNLNTLHELPSNGMGITAGKDLMYIYNRVKNKTKHALYTLHKGGIYNELFKVSAPIQSVVEMNQLILFSMGNTLFSFNPKNEELKALTALQKDKEINSITVDTTNNRIYFSSDSVVYAVNDSSKVIITNQFGGIIRFFDNGLIVFNPEKKFLIRILGIEEKLQSRIKEMKNETLTNTNIIKMVKAKLSDDLIIDVINSSNVDFNINPDSMIYLSNQNVSSEVIMAMKNAMKNKKK
ncbi:MAG: hypothetical protein HGB12_12015, partial [Bacteroidetes bacterium]|nr:hypothetical protein [Bacteroidota bacterium]